jgi:hypothetical protein
VLSLVILGIREFMLDRKAHRVDGTASPPMAGASEYAREHTDAS